MDLWALWKTWLAFWAPVFMGCRPNENNRIGKGWHLKEERRGVVSLLGIRESWWLEKLVVALGGVWVGVGIGIMFGKS